MSSGSILTSGATAYAAAKVPRTEAHVALGRANQQRADEIIGRYIHDKAVALNTAQAVDLYEMPLDACERSAGF